MRGANIGQKSRVVTLSLTGKTGHPSIVTVLTHPQDFTHTADWKIGLLLFNETKSLGLWLTTKPIDDVNILYQSKGRRFF